MKLPAVAKLLTLILWLFWFIPLQGKRFAPEIFGSSAVQWTTTAFVAVLIPVVALMALEMIFRDAQRRSGLGIFVFACLPLLFGLTVYGVGSTMLTRVDLTVQQVNGRDSEIIATLTERAISGATAESRMKSAEFLYTMFGVQPVWKSEAGNLERYHPTGDQQERQRETINTRQSMRKASEIIDLQLKQLPWLFGLYLGAFSLIFFGGLTWRAARGRDCIPCDPAGDGG
jgi:hypothetical protein